MTEAVDVWTDPDLVELVRQDASLIALADALVTGAHASAARDPRRRRAALVAAVLVVLVGALAPALAFSQTLRTVVGLAGPAPVPRGPEVHATLTSRLPKVAPKGKQIRIAWTLWSRNRDGRIIPFVAVGVFARMLNPAETAASTVPAHGTKGRYSAVVTVPPGGIGRIQVGMLVTRFSRKGTHPARAFFPITNYP